MDYFNTNFTDDHEDQYADLPEGFDWEEMKDGIYGKMGKEKPLRLRRYWPLFLLLLIGGCGSVTWLAMNQSDSQKVITKSIEVDKKETTALVRTDEEKQLESDIFTSITKQPIEELQDQIKSESNLTSGFIQPKNKKSQPLKNTVINKPLETYKKSTSFVTEKNKSIAQKRITGIKKVNKNITAQSTTLNKIEHLPFLNLGQIEPKTFQHRIIESKDKPTLSEKEKEHTVRNGIFFSMAGGITNLTTMGSDNINQDYVSGHPGYSFNPSIGFSFNKKHAIQLDYEYHAVQELFDYVGSHEIEVQLDNEPVRYTNSSLTGNLISVKRESVSAQGIRNLKEVKYNQLKFHTLSLGYRFDQITMRKSSYGFYLGASYLMQINGNGKRLNDQDRIEKFGTENPIFRKNQFGLRFGLRYSYQLNKNTNLFAQVTSTKYLTNWEVSTSNFSTKPLTYGLQVGLNYSLINK